MLRSYRKNIALILVGCYFFTFSATALGTNDHSDKKNITTVEPVITQDKEEEKENAYLNKKDSDKVLQVDCAKKPSIKDCPNLYKDECGNADFREMNSQNTFACLDVIAGDLNTKPLCLKYDIDKCKRISPSNKSIKDCSNSTKHPLKKFLCEKGYPECSHKIKILKKGFDNISKKLDMALSPYQDLIRLNTKGVSNEETLCNYSSAEITALQKRANADRSELALKTDELKSLRSCYELITEFMTSSSKPTSLTDQLWENMKNTYHEQIKTVSHQEGIVNSKIEEIEQAPDKINGLSFAHEMMCDDESLNKPKGIN